MEFKGFKQGNQYNPVCLLNVGKNNVSYLAISAMQVASCLPPVITINPRPWKRGAVLCINTQWQTVVVARLL